MTEYSGTGFEHLIPFSDYANIPNEYILEKYDNTTYSAEKTGTCIQVIDGDTIDFQDSTSNNIIRVRLVGVNTPENGALGYSASKKFVEKLILNQEISLNIDSRKQQDNYGRTLAIVIINNKNLNEILLNERLAEVMYIPPSEFNPNTWVDDIIDEVPESSPKTETIQLPSTIIYQKKKLFLFVEQSQDLVWPNGKYSYQIYVKNISGQIIQNLKIYIANPKEVLIPTKNKDTYNIPELKPGQSVLINVNNCIIGKEGYYYVNFIATADESEIKTQTLMIKCGYENDNKNILHRISFYNFSPYENAYMQRVSDFSDTVTQLTKIQTKPFGTQNAKTLSQMQYLIYETNHVVKQYQNKEISFKEYKAWFDNIQEEYKQVFETTDLELDLYAQDKYLINTDDMPSMYLGRENWESNTEDIFLSNNIQNPQIGVEDEDESNKSKSESYTGKTLNELIKYINRESDLVDINFLRIGSNEMENNFQRIYPNGFIHRFGLMKSEFYKLLGIIPEIHSTNDDLFRWARANKEPAIYPERENDKWDRKPWCGTGYYIYECVTNENNKIIKTEKAIFTTEDDAQIYVDNLEYFNKTHFIDNISYIIMKRDWLPGVFYVEIPLADIPANFLLPDIDQIQAIIELSKPLGLKGYPRFNIKNDFDNKMHFSYLPTIKPQIQLNLGEYSPLNYYIEQKKFINTNDGVKLSHTGTQFVCMNQQFNEPTILSYYPKVNVCKTLEYKIKYFANNKKIYIHLYSSKNNIHTDEDVIELSPDILFNKLQKDNVNISGAYMNYGTTSQKFYNSRQVLNQNTLKKTICGNKNVFVIVNEVDNAMMLDDTIKIDKEDNTQYQQYHYFEKKVMCSNKKTFDGQHKYSTPNDNHLNQLLAKNAEDISFYIHDNNGFISQNSIANERRNVTSLENKPIKPKYSAKYSYNDYGPIRLSRNYKTLNYFDDNTGIDYLISSSYKAFMISKDNNVLNTYVNFMFRNADDTKSHIISYKRLYDDMYQISYKTYKNKEVVVKEIITEFSQLLFEIVAYDNTKELIKIYYKLQDKLYFFTAFTSKIIKNSYYNLRICLTSEIAVDNDIELSLESIRFGELSWNKIPDIDSESIYPDWFLSNKPYSTLLSTDYYKPSEIVKTSEIQWNKLYKINKDDNTFTTFKNIDSEKTKVNSIQLYLDDINIPQNAIIDKIYLDIYSHVVDNIYLTTEYQTNANLYNNTNNIGAIFNIDDYQIYKQHNKKYLYNQLAIATEKENENNMEKYKKLIAEHDNINKNINIGFSKENPLTIRDRYWNEVSFEESTKNLKSSDFKQAFLILEGYNHSDNVKVHCQLAYYDNAGTINKDIIIHNGYFYKKIPIEYNVRYNIASLNVRFKFENIEQIDLYNVKSEIFFNQPQTPNDNLLKQGDRVRLQGIKKQICNVAENLDGDCVRNGLIINLNFDDIQNYIKIYSAIVNIVYHEKAFTNVFEISDDFNAVNSSEMSGLIRGCVFDEQVSDMRQDTYTTKKSDGEYDAGFEVDNRIYQAFTATNDNVTSIELKPNGKVGSPDSHLKIAILDNYDDVPNNVLKEVIVDVSKTGIFDKEASKYNIYVDNLKIGDTYWFSIEPLDKTKVGARRFYYNNHQVGEYKLLKIHNDDVVNQHASLYFRLYTKANTYSFKKLPYVFDPIVYNFETELSSSDIPHEQSDRNINYITEIQIFDGIIKNLTESLFSNNSNCPKE